MSSLKIAALDIHNFRGIRRATIDCNADVVLIYGRNGAGKTTIYDAIEYALFGCNRRLENLAKRSDDKDWQSCLPNALGDGSFDIGLQFQSGATIEVHRAADGSDNGSSWVNHSNRRDFIYSRLMKDTTRGRRSVAAMHDLALSTHLLLQSEIAGFAASGTLDGEKLAALTGSGYIERCRGKAADALKYARSRYKTSVAQRDELVQRREEALRRFNRIAASLARRDELLVEMRPHAVHFPTVAALTVAAPATEWARILADVRAAVATAAEQVGLVRALSDSPPESVDETALRGSLAALRELIDTTESQRSSWVQQLASAHAILDDATRSQAARAQRHASAEKLLFDATRLRELGQELPTLEAARHEASVAETNAKDEENSAATAADTASAALTQAVDAHARLHAQRSHVAAAADSHARAVGEEEQLERDIASARADMSRVALEAEQARSTARAARDAFDEELQRFTNIAPDIDRLTTELQALIHSESDCPLCGSNFGSPSALSRAIVQHGQRRTATLDGARRTLDARRREQDRLEGAASRADAALAGVTERLATLESSRSRARAARENAAEQLSKLANGDTDVARTLTDVSARLGAASARVDELRRSSTDASARLAAGRLTRQNASAFLRSAVSALQNAQRKSAVLESDVRRAAAELGVAPELDAITNVVSSLDEELRAGRENAAAHTTTVRAVTDALTRASEDLSNAETRHESDQRRLHEAIRRREVRTQQLAVLGLPAAASREDIELVGVAARERQVRLRELAGMMSELVDIANSGTVGDFAVAKQELENYERDALVSQRELDALTSVGTTLNRWESSLRQRVEAAVRDFVFPRAAEIENTFRSLVADPLRFERILVDHDTSQGLRLGLVFRTLTVPSGSPEFFLSAAQMSALALAIFLSLARSQTWSWLDTILLDDPVQHLDDLDCLALLDGLRNVARHSRSKQLIISTCDRSLYHHMIRKFSLTSAPAESTLLAIRLEEDLANGVRLHYEVDSRSGGPNSVAGASSTR
ncbi:MAG TPA: AAA family ATPase [Thermoanaerobaculia bacterium]|nr:AAA family ATPase [Thermoanaerobaculia bacterium]